MRKISDTIRGFLTNQAVEEVIAGLVIVRLVMIVVKIG